MRLTVNGKGFVTEAATLEALMEELAVKPAMVAVEVNLAVVSKRDYPTYGLKEGDRVEIVNFVGGG